MRNNFIAITVLAAIFFLGMPAQAAEKFEPYPLEEWAKRADMQKCFVIAKWRKVSISKNTH